MNSKTDAIGKVLMAGPDSPARWRIKEGAKVRTAKYIGGTLLKVREGLLSPMAMQTALSKTKAGRLAETKC